MCNILKKLNDQISYQTNVVPYKYNLSSVYSEMDTIIEFGQELNTHWVLWKQESVPKGKWSSNCIKKINNFSTVEGFWGTYDNTKFKEGDRYIFMRKGIEPMWEDPSHSNGAYIKINIRKTNHMEIFMNFVLGLIGESLVVDQYDSSNITGMTFVNEQGAKQLKIWISDKTKPLNKSNVLDEFTGLVKCSTNQNPYILIPFDSLYDKHPKKQICMPKIVSKPVLTKSEIYKRIICAYLDIMIPIKVNSVPNPLISARKYIIPAKRSQPAQKTESVPAKTKKQIRNAQRKKYFYPKKSGSAQMC
jgi:hypothetical protein